MEKVLLQKEELDTIKEIQQTELNLVDQLGSVEYQIQTLQLQKDNLRQEIIKLQTKSQKFGDDLQQKYGDGNINIETGEFTKID
jgi:peptidoglycan hydrolase CwlO-like protein